MDENHHPFPYRAISCEVYDRLEHLAVKKINCHFLNPDLSLKFDDRIVDIYTSSKVEYIKTASDEIFRLDEIVNVFENNIIIEKLTR